jgi:hypothetical protein
MVAEGGIGVKVEVEVGAIVGSEVFVTDGVGVGAGKVGAADESSFVFDIVLS